MKYLKISVSLLSVIVIVLCFGGCSSVPLCTPAQAETAIIEEFNNCITDFDASSNPFLEKLVKSAEVTVKSVEKSKKDIHALCTISNYNAAEVLAAFSDDISEMTVSEGMSILTDALADSEKAETATTITINYTEDNGYSASLTQEQLDSMLGGLITFYSETDIKTED